MKLLRRCDQGSMHGGHRAAARVRRLGYYPGRDAAALPREKGLLGSRGMSAPSCFSPGDVPGHQWDAAL